MEFKKYFSIENHYQTKNLQYWCEKYPELINEQFAVQEKLHGSNIQFYVKNGEFKLGRRKDFLKKDEKFSGIWEVIKEDIYQKIIEDMKEYSNNYDSEIILYGEFFGGNINKGVNYGDKKKIRFFDITIDNKLLVPSNINIVSSKYTDYFIPYNVVNSLQEALDFDTTFDSAYAVDEPKMCEGVVIKPLNKVYMNNGETFYIKKKNDKFLERSRAPKVIRKPKKDKVINPLLTYLNENRINSVFSKEGEITNKSQIGDYIRWITQDMIEDWEKDTGLSYKTESKLQNFESIGNAIFNLLKHKL